MRGDTIIKASLENGFFALAPNVMGSILNAVNQGIPKITNSAKTSNGNVVYEEFKNVAVISIDGAMYKKDMSGECMSVIAYPNIIKEIKKADAAPHIDTTLFRVDTPGGHVDGADEVEQILALAKNKTIIFAENTLASGGLWIFPAADEMYAAEATMIGSVGVVATYRNPEADTNIIEQTSSNAPNKRCSLGEDCKQKMQTMLDTYESMFFARLEKNTGFNAEKIKTTFNNGGMIFAKEALDAGFIKGITTFDILLAQLTQVGVNQSSLTASAQIKNSTQGKSMEYTKEKFLALENTHAEAMKAMIGERDTVTATLVEVSAKLATAEAVVAEHATLKASVEAKAKVMPEIMAMAFERGVDKLTLLAMANADSLDKAKVALVDGMSSNGAFGAAGESSSENKIEEKETDIQARADKLGVTFIGEK